MNLIITGNKWRELELQGSAWFQPGKKLFLEIGLAQDLCEEELTEAHKTLVKEGIGLLSPLQIGTGAWPNTLRMEFKNPKDFAISPFLTEATILALGTVDIKGILGWRIGRLQGAQLKVQA